MDFNIDPLLNMTFDENGIEDFFKLYENQLDHELNLLKTTSSIQQKIKNNENLLQYDDYDRIDEELNVFSQILEIQTINDEFFCSVDDLENKIKFINKEKEEFSLEKTITINTYFLEFLEQINENILVRLHEISVLNSYKSTIEAFQKEMFDRIFIALTAQSESAFIAPNNESIAFIQQKTNLPLIK